MTILDLTVGAVEVGTLISTVFFGIVASLVFKYLELGFKDPIVFRLMIALTCLLEVIHTVFLWAFLYKLTVTDYGNPVALLVAPWSYAGAVVCTSLMSMHVQMFIGYKLRVLSGSMIVPIICGIGAVFHSVITFVLVGDFMSFGSFTWLLTHEWMVILDLSVHAGTDILLAAFMVYTLIRKRSGFKATQRVVDKLILYTIETGGVTSLFSLTTLTCAVTMNTNYIYITFLVIYPKLFSIVFLASLTSRLGLRRDLGKLSVGSMGVPSTGHTWTNPKSSENRFDSHQYATDTMQLPQTSPKTPQSTRRTTAPEVQITTEFEVAISKSYDSDVTNRC